MVQNNIP